MNHVIGKIRKRDRNNKYKILLSGQVLYSVDYDFENFIPYAPDHNLDEDSWFGLNRFSSREYCLDFIKNNFNSTNYEQMDRQDFDKIDYIVAFQNSNEFHFQRVSPMQLVSKKYISLGDQFRIIESSKEIVINEMPDAIYVKDKDTLFFKKLSSITSIFKGIDFLYREATNEEVTGFLSKEFVKTGEDFSYQKVNVANRKRIALAIEQLNAFEEDQKTKVFESIREYCPGLVSDNGAFKINDENDLKLLLFGIGQRFYTTPDGKEKRIANSIIRL